MLPPPVPEGAPWATWVALGLLVVAGGFVTARVWRWLRRRASVPPEPKDPPALQAALTVLADLLPQNPRDTIRIVNAIRATYLLQAQGVAAAEGAPTLEAGDCVLYTLLQHLAPDFFDPDTIEGKVVPALAGSAGPLEARLAALRQAVPQAGLLLAALGRIKDAPRDLAQPLADAGKLLRFVALNRFLLDVVFEPEPGAEAKPA
ncbi:MAG: hypothetical protein IRY94_04480 [Rhodospirillaceae bacterium]|nr:hypothetical protein [Rhodospirillaceae bacterium]